MQLGKRIRQARQEAGLSQRQLCEGVVTRNMLSLIESGSARPSMETLTQLAKRLGKPVSWFLEEQTVTSPNRALMDTARQCWKAGDGAGALKALEEYSAPDETFDEERGLLTHMALLQLARQALEEDRLPYARALLEKAEGCRSIYLTPQWSQQLLRAKAQLPAALECDELLLAKAEQALRAGDPGRCVAVLGAADDRLDGRWQLLMGLALLERQEYAAAAEHLVNAESAFPEQTAPKLEICFRELGDYRRAYEYACRQR